MPWCPGHLCRIAQNPWTNETIDSLRRLSTLQPPPALTLRQLIRVLEQYVDETGNPVDLILIGGGGAPRLRRDRASHARCRCGTPRRLGLARCVLTGQRHTGRSWGKHLGLVRHCDASRLSKQDLGLPRTTGHSAQAAGPVGFCDRQTSSRDRTGFGRQPVSGPTLRNHRASDSGRGGTGHCGVSEGHHTLHLSEDGGRVLSGEIIESRLIEAGFTRGLS